MRQSKLFQLLEKFDPRMLREARKWLASPLHNTRTEVLALYDFCAEGLHKNPDRLLKPAAFAACYGPLPYDEREMNHLMSWLLENLREYLTWSEWQQDAANVALLRCRALQKLGLDEAFEKAYEQAQQLLERQPYRDEQYYAIKHALERGRQEHASLQRRALGASIQPMGEHAEMAYKLNRLRYECSLAVLQYLTPSEATPEMSLSIEEPPTVLLYKNLLRSLQDATDEAAFSTARDLLEQHGQLFRGSERRDLYLMALNFCIRKINKGDRKFMRDALDLYRSGIENRSLFEYGLLSRFTYKNVVTAGLNLGAFDWTREFIETYRAHLHPRERHSVYCYNLAIWYFWRNDYDQAMTLLSEMDFADPLTNLDARAILLKIYYERGFDEALESHLDSFQTYLNRHKNLGYHRENYLNLLKVVRKMLRLGPQDRQERAQLANDITQTAALAEKAWLLRCLG